MPREGTRKGRRTAGSPRLWGHTGRRRGTQSTIPLHTARLSHLTTLRIRSGLRVRPRESEKQSEGSRRPLVLLTGQHRLQHRYPVSGMVYATQPGRASSAKASELGWQPGWPHGSDTSPHRLAVRNSGAAAPYPHRGLHLLNVALVHLFAFSRVASVHRFALLPLSAEQSLPATHHHLLAWGRRLVHI